MERTCYFLLVVNTNVHPVSRRFQVIADYWSNLRFRQRVSLYNILVRGEPINCDLTKFGLKKLETLLYCVVQKCFSILTVQGWLTSVTDGQTNRTAVSNQ